jgi:histidinol-phosphate aminotransferase
MAFSRRSFFRNLGIGAATGAVAQVAVSDAWAVFADATAQKRVSPILLNKNENPYGPSETVRKAINGGLNGANRYPDMEYDGLVERIAALHRIKPEQVILGCGSTEILRVATCAFLGPGALLVQAAPTYEAIEVYAHATGANIASVQLDREFAHDLDAMLQRISTAGSLVYICNPNNPTASITPRKDLETFIAQLPMNSYVLIDEAYHHYSRPSSSYQSFVDHPVDDERVIVSRTFSNAYGLAGLRVGYGIAHPAAAKKMRTYLTMGSINEIAVAAAIAAIEDNDALHMEVQRNQNERQEFFNQAISRTLRPVDSHTNFVFMNVRQAADEVIRQFQENNILLGRSFPRPFDTYVRISLGLRPEMQAFWQVWDRLPRTSAAPMSH